MLDKVACGEDVLKVRRHLSARKEGSGVVRGASMCGARRSDCDDSRFGEKAQSCSRYARAEILVRKGQSGAAGAEDDACQYEARMAVQALQHKNEYCLGGLARSDGVVARRELRDTASAQHP